MRLATCCGCITLQVGTIIIGVLSLIVSIGNVLHISLGEPTSTTTGQHIFDPQTENIIDIVMGVVGLIASVLLLIGAHKRNANMISPWLVLMAISLILTAIRGVLLLFSAIEVGLGVLIFTAVFVYLWLVVYSHYHEVK